MNRFWLDVEIEEEAAHWSNAHGKVFVDGEEIEAPAVHIAELARSLLEPGKFSIFTCGCGDALCGHVAQRIAVAHHAGQVGWRFRDPVFFWRYGMAQDLTWDEQITDWRRRSYQTKLVFDHVSMLDEVISAINWTLSNVDRGIPDDGLNFFVALTSRSEMLQLLSALEKRRHTFR